MKKYIVTDNNNRIIVVEKDNTFHNNGFYFELPEDFVISNFFEYKIIDNQLVHEPLPQPKPEPSLQEQIDDLTLLVAEMVGA